MNFKNRSTLLLIVVLLFLVGIWLGGLFWPEAEPAPVVVPPEVEVLPEPVREVPPPEVVEEPPLRIEEGLAVELFTCTQPRQVVIRFPEDVSYRDFVSDVRGTRVALLGQLDPLRAMRLGYEDPMDLVALLEKANVTRYAGLPDMPAPPPSSRSEQRGLVGFENQALRWLGAAENRAKWGAGVRVAVIDGGIEPHAGLRPLVAELDVSAKPGSWKNHTHGTGVASLIAGIDPRAPGVAPAASLISINVFDDSGRADAFAVASGLLAAIDHQADVVNISLGSDEDNPLIREAVALVQQRGIVVVAASGNSAGVRSAFPAALPGVVGVGAVDANRVQLDFSNYGDTLAITAPGYRVVGAFPEQRYLLLSGTSVSAPLVTGTIAAVMANDSPYRLSAGQASELVLAYTDEEGIPGPDSQYGFGILNIGRVMNRSRQGVADAAITHMEITNGGVNVTVQNRGTSTLINLLLEVGTGKESRTLNVTTLPAREVRTLFVPFPFRNDGAEAVVSRVHIGSNGPDPTPDNNVMQKFPG